MGIFDDMTTPRRNGMGGLLALLGMGDADASQMPRQPNGHRSSGHIAAGGIDTATGRSVMSQARQRAMMDEDMRAQGGYIPPRSGGQPYMGVGGPEEQALMEQALREAEQLREVGSRNVPLPPRRPGVRGEVPMDYVPQRLPAELEDGSVVMPPAPRTLRRLSARSS